MHKSEQDHQAQNSSQRDGCIKSGLSSEIWKLWVIHHSSALRMGMYNLLQCALLAMTFCSLGINEPDLSSSIRELRQILDCRLHEGEMKGRTKGQKDYLI